MTRPRGSSPGAVSSAGLVLALPFVLQPLQLLADGVILVLAEDAPRRLAGGLRGGTQVYGDRIGIDRLPAEISAGLG